MDRAKSLSVIADTSILWDVIIIGGGASGIGVAVDSAARGYKTLLVEQVDFGKGTSSRSTKLAHGGVRYLQQGNISLVLEALKERGIMKRNAPHLVKDLEFVVPVYDWWEGPFYGIGLKLYDILAGKEGLGASQFLSKEETIKKIPTVETDGLKGGVIYHDGQFDDVRLLINLAQTAHEQGASIANYVKVVSILKNEDLISGVEVEDQETGKMYKLRSKLVINATGVFTDTVRKMDDASATPIMTSSQGVHIVLDKSFLPGDSAIMVPHTDDGRVLFAVPWHDKIIVGTTDTPVKEYPLEPIALDEEIEFLLTHAARYLTNDPSSKDIKSIFVGLRPLVMEGDTQNTAAISREHTINISRSGLLSIAGGKWTTYRKMAEDVVDQAILIGDLDSKKCLTEDLQIYGYHQYAEVFGDLEQFGSAAANLINLLDEKPNYKNKLHPDYSHVEGEVIWAVRKEMARNIEDFLARRTRLLFLDVEASLLVAPKVAQLMAQELGHNKGWENLELEKYTDLTRNYRPKQVN
ncbi:glycerol-3-phosphate dehydrogenase/oxidase [Labilibaculum sp. DW002]|uniref:Glycerol-3-phosphate dehydrogenase/oxidase n=1 Tax=Paralabilibaculum antarcticum TaxID=2912572 RepID=A0ABT5VPG2_9BACT|nr:glycerol-3-phosphate dehydrogenase/oxidase [Labilibaculum sp. DW002]MDE5417324.1 glycerol-3-phosphate dehydrogenase/oxidase [Labilibaculum sp. DW002]